MGLRVAPVSRRSNASDFAILLTAVRPLGPGQQSLALVLDELTVRRTTSGTRPSPRRLRDCSDMQIEYGGPRNDPSRIRRLPLRGLAGLMSTNMGGMFTLVL